MTRSMTGFGRATCEYNGQVVTVEISAVNHRYLDATMRLPAAWQALEPLAKQTIRQHVERGKLSVVVGKKRAAKSAQSVHYDAEIARQYIEASRDLARMLGVTDSLPLSTFATLPGVFYQEEPEEDVEAVGAVLTGAFDEACRCLNIMRETEGRALAADVRGRIELIRAALGDIEARLPELNRLHETRLRTRIEELKADTAISEDRISIEVAMLAEKGDVTEEVVRLKTHLEHMEELLASPEPVGRRLDFLTQEIQREANTLGVKTRDADVTKDVIRIKGEIEKIREQVQNIE